ncbi:tRNA (guanine(46)-N(7))-methyltransferase TrmB [Candidatus Bealeia paramacronuclearis]|uniref:tRNA (guanine-N(7)-)-methyltransferase n=1 Tax=Candidatus Bealeia paramacronuclearis TaxID=1921001 RepID=A0ABZ2C136_9PROT|nr:tRNA (guanine(46)-N(7))-methyltransferase TrmB [Candidatus Bealeia paramacronuclearis]
MHKLHFYGRRKGKALRPRAQNALDYKLPQVLIPLETPLSFFEDAQEVWLEIGFGGGEHLASQLKNNPHVHIIGVEPFMNGVASLLKAVEDPDLPRLHLLPDDVRLLLPQIPEKSLSRIFVLFPDPWPKKRHHMRRLLQKEFLDLLLPKLKPGGIFRVASDHADYLIHIHEIFHERFELEKVFGPLSLETPENWPARPEGWPPTRYEQKALRQAIPCAYYEFRKRGA